MEKYLKWREEHPDGEEEADLKDNLVTKTKKQSKKPSKKDDDDAYDDEDDEEWSTKYSN